ncbi:hypothetical protein KC131_26910 [Pseudomonas sp. JQ170]|uniref:hypothetical protein n=1 Tax=unclassified Pseudomonas TaxID=196821 RepID=UPI0026557DDC|nr:MULTISPECIES: hypothetical protein [unclassified Pseudomonas]MDN7144279.1 hypothetical protein [Pseudomonas sp. JQ170]WRO74177.1 hypothetical protein U9R80_16790 [Pseudomonas sp. 170C]WRO77762.1 hypothetical protein U9R80_08820 [Pseudomonas sp. 170C]
MAAQYGLRTRDASGVVTLDTTITPIRSLKMLQVTGNDAFDQYISIPEIQAQSFVVVDTLEDRGENTFSPQAWYSPGQLQLRQPQNLTWQVMILSQGGEPFSAPGSYGIRTFNNNVRTQIDSINQVLSIRYSGKFSLIFGGGNPNIEGDNYYTFPAPITTYERPLIFINADDYMMVGKFRVAGSPGNWTGFRLAQYGNAAHGPSWSQPQRIRWFCASYMPPITPPGAYGASVRDAIGNRTFVTTANLALLNSQPSTNAFANTGNPITGTGYYAPSQQMPWTGSYEDYVLANALFSCTNIIQTTQPIRANFGGFLPGNRSILQMYCDNGSGINPLTANGRTLFASRPMKPL